MLDKDNVMAYLVLSPHKQLYIVQTSCQQYLFYLPLTRPENVTMSR